MKLETLFLEFRIRCIFINYNDNLLKLARINGLKTPQNTGKAICFDYAINIQLKTWGFPENVASYDD